MTDPVGRLGGLKANRLASVTPPPARHRPGGCRTRSGSVLRLGAQQCPGARRHQQTGMGWNSLSSKLPPSSRRRAGRAQGRRWRRRRGALSTRWDHVAGARGRGLDHQHVSVIITVENVVHGGRRWQGRYGGSGSGCALAVAAVGSGRAAAAAIAAAAHVGRRLLPSTGVGGRWAAGY